MRTTLFTLVALVAAPALAHPGTHHLSLFETLQHLLSEPYHLVLLALALAVGVGGAVWYARRAS
jgi:hypothetical protein